MRPLFIGIGYAALHWRRLLAMSIISVFASLLLIPVTAEVYLQAAVEKQAQPLARVSATYFTSFYRSSQVSHTGRQMARLLREVTARDLGFTTVINNFQIDDPNLVGLPKIVLFEGRAAQKYLPRRIGCPKATVCIFAGRDAIAAPPKVDIAGQMLKVRRLSSRGFAYFDPNLGMVKLDDKLVLLSKSFFLAKLDSYAIEEAVSRTILLNPARRLLDTYVRAAESQGLYLVPNFAGIGAEERVNKFLQQAHLEVFVFLVFFLLCGFSQSLLLLPAWRAHRNEIALRHIDGKRFGHEIITGVAFVVTMSLAVPNLLVLSLASLDPDLIPACSIAAMILFTSSLLSLLLVVRETSTSRKAVQ